MPKQLYLIFLLVLLAPMLSCGQTPPATDATPKGNTPAIKSLRYASKISLSIPEPSDISLAPDGKSYYIVSDNGILFQTELNGTVIRKAEQTGFDYEGVYCDASYVYVIDERTRQLHLYNRPDLKYVRNAEIAYSGGRNKGFESITFLPATKQLMLVTEKDPTLIFILNEDLTVFNKVKVKLTSDVSAICYHDGFIYWLSDEEHCVLKLNPQNYELLERYNLNVINPEGITFSPEGNMMIVSDDAATLYTFTLGTF
jgi:uncharacterized protein YjiK